MFNVTASNYIIKAINQAYVGWWRHRRMITDEFYQDHVGLRYCNSRSCRHPVFEILSHLTLVLSATVFEILTFKARKWLILPTLPLFDSPVQQNWNGEFCITQIDSLKTEICIMLPINSPESLNSARLKFIIPVFSPISCMALSAGQLPREMYSRLMPSISGVCESC